MVINAEVLVKSSSTIGREEYEVKHNASVLHPMGDHTVLCKAVEEKRSIVRNARTDLAKSLHQLGEHFVRSKEYDDAMKVFKESFDESCRAYGHNPEQSKLSEIVANHNNIESENGQKELEEIVSTLSSIGNVHSLREEHDQAMKCYTEMMSVRASFSNISRDLQADASAISREIQESSSCECRDDSESDDDINEDVKALDDLFRSISFRDRKNAIRKDPMSMVDETDKSSAGDNPRELDAFPGTEITVALEEYEVFLTGYQEDDTNFYKADYNLIKTQIEKIGQDCALQEEAKDNGAFLHKKMLYMTLIIYDRILAAQKSVATRLSTEEKTDLNEMKKASINVAATMIRIGGLHYRLSNMDEEVRMYNEALSTYIKALGTSHPYVAGTRKNIGMVLAERCQYTEAMEEFEKAKEIYTSHNNGSNMSSDVASALLCMGNVQDRQGEFDIALSMYSKALYIYRSLAEDTGWTESSAKDVTSTLKIIGMVYVKRADLDSAMQCYKEAMNLLSSIESSGVKSDSVDVASIRTRMGGILYKKGQYDDAMEQYQKAYSIVTDALGTNLHADVSGILHYMGIVHQKQSMPRKALKCFKESLNISRIVLGPDNPFLAPTLVCMGNLHFTRRSYDQSMIFYKEAYRLYDEHSGSNHPQISPTLKSIAMIHTKKGEYDQAMTIFHEILRSKCMALGSCHPETANAYKCIANLHMKQGELRKALVQYNHALDIYQRTEGGEKNPEAQAIIKNIHLIHASFENKERRERADERDQLSCKRSRYLC
jgi:tetratricopeptide (TPR) repeat protein